LAFPFLPQTVMRSPPALLSCVVPAYNEAAHLADFLQALYATATPLADAVEIIVVNDGSRDQTREAALSVAQACNVRYLHFSRNFGKEAALTAGLDHAHGDVVLLIDGDFQHPLEKIPEMMALWQSGVDMIYGVIVNRGAESRIKRLGTDLFYGLMDRGSSIIIPRNAGDFRLMDKKVADALRALPERNRFMKGLYAWVGFRSVALPFIPAERATGQSSFNFKRLASLALSGVMAFSTLPLRVWSLLGAFISLLAIGYGIFITFDTLINGNPASGWPTLAAGLMLFSGIQLLSIGILGEYLGRVYEEVKRRPIYLLAEDIHYSPSTPAIPCQKTH
jgi:polyisoprenyl-phosphate glycosyltransferase